MPRYAPQHRDHGRAVRATATTAESRGSVRAAVTAAVAVPLAAGLVGGVSAYAADSAPTLGEPVDALVDTGGRAQLPAEYGAIRSLVLGTEVDQQGLLPSPGLAVRDGLELEPRTTAPSRSALRTAAGPEVADVKVADRRWASKAVNLRSGPGLRYDVVDTVNFRGAIGVTGLRSGEWLQVKNEKQSMWVNRELVVRERPAKPEPKPEPAATTSSSSGSASSSSSAPAAASGVCSNGTSVSGGPNVIAVHNAVCAAYPSITEYGTYRADSEYHASGRAIDVMVSGSTGWSVAEFVRANASSLGVSEVIYAQQIWTVERSSEGWRPMEDRGSTTANHYDHVHVSTY